MEAEHTSFFWPEVDDLLTYEFSADLMDQLHAGLHDGPPAQAPPPPAPSFPPAGAPPMPGPGSLTMPAPPPGAQPIPLSGPNPFLPGPAGQPTVSVPDPGMAGLGSGPAGVTQPGVVPPVPDLKLSSPVASDSDPTIRTSELEGYTPPPPAEMPAPAGAGYVPDVVAGSFGAEMAPPPPPGPVDGGGSAGLDGLRGSRLFDPRPEPPEASSGRLRVGNLFEPTDPGGPPQTRRLVRLAGRQSPDDVDVTSARLVSPFDSSGPSVRSLFPASSGDERRPGRAPFADDGFGPGVATSELRMGSPAPFGPDAGPFGNPAEGGYGGPPVSLSHSTVVDPSSGPPVGSSFLAPAPSDAWSSSNPAWTSVSDTVSDLPPRQGQGFLYMEDDADPWSGPQVLRQAEPAGRDKGAMVDSVLDVLDRKRGALLAGALALTAVLGGLLAFSKLSGDGTDASGSFTAVSNTTRASSVSSATGESGSGAGAAPAGPTTALDSAGSEAPSSAATEAGSTSSTRKKATTSSASTASTAAPTDPTTASTEPPTSPTTQPGSSTTTTRPTTTTTRATTTTTASTTTTTKPTTTSSATTSTTAATDPPTTPSTAGSSSTPAIATP